MMAQLISACRAAGIRVSTAETLDAMKAAAQIGVASRASFKLALSLTLAKTAGDKELFSSCFDRFMRLSEQSAEDDLSASDRMEVSVLMMQAAERVGLDQIKLFTQRGLYVRRLLDEAGAAQLEMQLGENGQKNNVQDNDGRARLAAMSVQARYMVDRQLEMSQGANMLRVRREMLMDMALGEADQRDLEIMSYQVRRLAKKMALAASRRIKRDRRGHPDIARSLRANLKNDGVMVDLVWKTRKITRPRIFALCDVSGSVSSAVRFLLMFLYNLTDVVSDMRAFVFSNRLGEVSGLFRESEFGWAYGQALRLYGGGSTDYGQSLRDFDEQAGHAVDRKTVMIILGDARSNYGDAGADVLARLSAHAGRVLWLNPEPESLWGSGDSEMERLGVLVNEAHSCRTLRQLTHIIDEVIKLRV